MDYRKMVQKCKKDVSNPQMESHNGQEENGNQFNYVVCSCRGCNVCLRILSV